MAAIFEMLGGEEDYKLDKVCSSAEEAIADIGDGAMIAVAGFFVAGVPRFLLRALIARGIKDLILTCGCGPLLGVPEELAQMVKNRQIKRVIDSYGLYRSASKGAEDPFERAVKNGEIELRICPMGTLAEKYRAAAVGIPAFYTPTGVGSAVEDSIISSFEEGRRLRETRIFKGERYILEYALKPEFAFVHAYMGDREGNLRYRLTAKNFNPVMAAAAGVTIAEVENLVEPGEMEPDEIHTPGIYVQRVVQVPRISVPVTID